MTSDPSNPAPAAARPLFPSATALPVWTSSRTAPPLDAVGRLDADIPCRKCGFNLRGLLPGGVCPECGTAIGRSLQGDFLRFCDPEWLGSLTSGMNWLIAAIVFSTVLGCLGGGITIALRSSRLPILAQLLVGTVTAFVSFIGYWKVTTPDPGQSTTDEKLSARRVVRMAQVAGLAFLAVNQTALLLSLPVIWLGVGSSILSTVSTGATLVYARQLALRIPNDGLARQTRIVMCGVIVLFILIFGTTIFWVMPAVPALRAAATSMPAPTTMISGRRVTYSYSYSTTMPVRGRGPMPPFVAAGMTIGCLSFILIGFGIWALILIGRYQREFKEAARFARESWSVPPRPPVKVAQELQ